MTFDLDDTICAIASAPGGALRGIVRISGPSSLQCVAALVRAEPGELTAGRAPSCSSVVLTVSENLGEVPVRLYVWPTTRSYTRQPSAELHLPGSPPLLEAALAALCRAGARLARPGEFTLRALLAGRIDLTQAEAVLGVIDAQSPAELEVALSQLAGGLARPLAALRGELLDLLAHLEAGLDFADEDIEFISADQLRHELQDIARRVAEVESRLQSRAEAGSLPRVVLVGQPNAGKSSLFNALSEDASAIVSEFAGTTRDFVARRIAIEGRECLLIDTAGVHTESDEGELAAMAQHVTRGQTRQADLTVLCLDVTRDLTEWERARLTLPTAHSDLVVWTKCDLAARANLRLAPAAILTSSVSGQGLDLVREAIAARLRQAPSESCVVAGTADRCRASLARTREALSRALSAVAANGGEELVAAELRIALDELGHVVGAVYTDDVLDRIFSRFCIGK
jgi:tRNA modification GTPase